MGFFGRNDTCPLCRIVPVNKINSLFIFQEVLISCKVEFLGTISHIVVRHCLKLRFFLFDLLTVADATRREIKVGLGESSFPLCNLFIFYRLHRLELLLD